MKRTGARQILKENRSMLWAEEELRISKVVDRITSWTHTYSHTHVPSGGWDKVMDSYVEEDMRRSMSQENEDRRGSEVREAMMVGKTGANYGWYGERQLPVNDE